MVVLSAAICTKNGKTLLARQFVEMTRIRIEGLLAAFPKLMGSDSKQHTYIETESVRYVYQPVENLFLLVITNRASNIVEDLETLRLLSKVVPDIAGATNHLTEEKVLEKVYDLIFAFDEVITSGGYREPITIQQIRTNMEMDSHEEKLHKMIKESKMDQAKDQAKEAARSIMDRKRMEGIGSSLGANTYHVESNITESSPSVVIPTPKPSIAPTATVAPIRGMDIVAKSNTKDKSLFDALVKEEKLSAIITKSNTVASAENVQAAATVVQHPIMLQSIEKITATLNRDGDVNNVEVRGNLTLTAADDDVACCAIQLSAIPNHAAFTFNAHPKINKALYDKNQILVMKDTTKGFPAGRAVGILRWSNSASSMDYVPITINCWPEEEGSKGKMLVTIDYNASNKFPLHDVKIHIPIHSSEIPVIKSIDGRYKYSKANNELVWEIDMIDNSNTSGNLEFTIMEKDTESFFPITIEFSSQQMFCNMDVLSVKTVPIGAEVTAATNPLMFGYTKGMATEEYTIE